MAEITAAPVFRLEQIVRARQEVMEDFEGPLDLILDLLRRNRIDIQDLRISTLLEQYLAWIDLRQSLDLEVASEFIAMASHLVYLKTRMLLSVGEERDEEVDELILALEERLRQEKLLRSAVGRDFLESRAELARSILTKAPEPIQTDRTYAGTHEAHELLRALGDMYDRAERRVPPPPSVFSDIVGHEPYPVEEKIGAVLSFLRRGRALLRAVLRARTRSEVVATFLAVLELVRSRSIQVEEEGGDYVVTLASGVREENGTA